MFVQCAQAVRSMFPDIQVQGEVYPPTPLRSWLSSVLQVAFLAGIAVSMFPQMLPEQAANWATQNRGMLIVMVFMCNYLSGQLLSTGAFEISYNGTLIFSKLKEGHMLNLNELRFLIDQARSLPAQ
eukprot:RCo037506